MILVTGGAGLRRNAVFFRFVHVSTDAVSGGLSPSDPPFSETNHYQPRSDRHWIDIPCGAATL
jgi:hypothetical protein